MDELIRRTKMLIGLLISLSGTGMIEELAVPAVQDHVRKLLAELEAIEGHPITTMDLVKFAFEQQIEELEGDSTLSPDERSVVDNVRRMWESTRRQVMWRSHGKLDDFIGDDNG